MHTKFRQPYMGWCTVYTWANLLNENAILNFTKDERFKGCGEKEEAEILADFLPNCNLQTVAYSNQAYPALPLDFIWSVLTHNDIAKEEMEHPCIIYTMTVRLIKEVFHHVGVVNYKGNIWYTDPYREKWINLKSFFDLGNLFIDCCQIQRPYLKATNEWALFHGGPLNYEFLTN